MSAGGVSALDLAGIEARLKAATPGPWSVKHRHCMHEPPDDESCGLGLEIVGPPEASNRGQFYRGADAVFIAHAPSDVAALVEAVKALWAALLGLVCRTDAYRATCVQYAITHEGAHTPECAQGVAVLESVSDGAAAVLGTQ